MLDFYALVYQLLTRSMPAVEFIPEYDLGTTDRVPLVMYRVDVGNSVPGSISPPTAWVGSIAFSIFASDRDTAQTIAEQLYEAVWSWDSAWSGTGTIDGLGSVGNIDDQSVFSLTAVVDLNALHMTQYDGTFGLQFYRE